jgi:hypothetical protein
MERSLAGLPDRPERLAGAAVTPRLTHEDVLPARSDAGRRPAPDRTDRQELRVGAAVHEAYARYIVHPSGLVRIQIIDARSNQVIREIPPEQVVRIAEELQAYLRARRSAARSEQGGDHV